MRYRPPGIIDHLNGLMARHGWLRDEDLRAAAEVLGVPLHRVEGVASFYPLYRRSPPAAVTVHVCRDLSCSMRGGEEAIAQLTAAAAARERETGERHEVVRSSCLGRCDQAPACLVHHVPMDMESMRRTLVAAAASEPPAAEPCAPKRLACDPYAGAWGDRYATVRRIAEGGAAAADQVLAALADAGLRGMGGAGFPTARKWGFVRGASGDEKFVICNADESEPGTFKDRELLRSAPHLVWEGMMIAALVVGARRCITYIRHEYEPERANLERERARAQEVADALGITLEIFVSPGGYIQGEETALLEALEDRRGEPRNKPPFPGIEGLFGLPTLINNVETLTMVTAIVARGARWWKEQGVNGCHGLKLLSVSGDVEAPGVYEVPMGTTLAELIERAGGVLGGAPLLAVLPGGASSSFLPADKADTPLDFDRLAAAGSTLGSGGVVVVAEGRRLLDLGVSLTRFFRNESCGKCVPCRIGTTKAVTLLEEMSEGTAPARALALLDELDATLGQTSICGLGQVALVPAMSILRRFPGADGAPGSAD